MQILKVIFGTLLLIICAIFSLRFYGLGKMPQIFAHPILERERPWIIAWGGDLDAGPSHSRIAFAGAVSRVPGVFLGASVLMSADKRFFVFSPELLSGLSGDIRTSGDMRGGTRTRGLSDQSDREILEADLGNGQKPLRLEEFLEEFGQTPLLLWVEDNIENVDLRLEPILKKYADKSNLLIHSEFDNVIKSLKKLLPTQLYGTGVGQRVRLLMLSSLWLEPVAAIEGDFLVTPLRDRGIKSISEEMKEELDRRQKLLILGPLKSPEENDEALSFGASGYISAFPEDIYKKIK